MYLDALDLRHFVAAVSGALDGGLHGVHRELGQVLQRKLDRRPTLHLHLQHIAARNVSLDQPASNLSFKLRKEEEEEEKG